MDPRATQVATEPSLVEALTVAQRQVARALGTVLAEEGFSVDQWRVLRTLGDGLGHLMGELAERLQMPHPSLTRMMDGLVDSSLVYRRQAPDDRRRVSVHLSRQGRAKLDRLSALVAAQEDALRASPEWTALSRPLRRALR